MRVFRFVGRGRVGGDGQHAVVLVAVACKTESMYTPMFLGKLATVVIVPRPPEGYTTRLRVHACQHALLEQVTCFHSMSPLTKRHFFRWQESGSK